MQQIRTSNMIGLYTLYMREIHRFLKVYTQTIIGPIVTSLLFLSVFVLAMGRDVNVVGSIPFMEFLAPGLIMMSMTQNAFANTSSSMMISKVQGNIVDTLMPPLSSHELTLGIALGGATRGVVVGTAVGIVVSFVVPMQVHSLGLILFHAIGASLMMSLLGIIGGIWSEKFDHIAGLTNFIVTPLSFLSGTFYSINRLPELAQSIALMNPFFYMIDGFRYGFIGHSDAPIVNGMLAVGGMDVVLWIICWKMFDSGYKLKP
ncbi:MAG: multidrug ABC transporter permease [Rhodospirillaceae bacterium]|nr:MAG: multidrug ABC transporter permease [Rhodospirillaceae bacterium]